jgi:hypothetical protein
MATPLVKALAERFIRWASDGPAVVLPTLPKPKPKRVPQPSDGGLTICPPALGGGEISVVEEDPS